jgi:hypothetical protein
MQQKPREDTYTYKQTNKQPDTQTKKARFRTE